MFHAHMPYSSSSVQILGSLTSNDMKDPYSAVNQEQSKSIAMKVHFIESRLELDPSFMGPGPLSHM